MNNLATWFIGSSIALLLFIMVYRLMLNRITLLKTGRFYLIFTMLLALIIPLPWQNFISSANEIAFTVNLEMPVIFSETETVQNSHDINWIHLLIGIYFVPALALLLFIFVSNFRVWLLIRRSDLVIFDSAKIYVTGNDILPFSWFGKIVVSRKDYHSQFLGSILAHEKAHVRQHHFIDLLVVEIMAILQWFNPAVWLYRSAIRDVHEYLADRATLNNGFDIPEYQRLLAGLTGIVPAGVLSNNMKHSLLKNRLIMMTKTNSGKFEHVKLMSALIASVLIGWGIFTVTCQAQVEQTQTKTEEIIPLSAEPLAQKPEVPAQPDTIFIVVDEMPEFPGGDEARMKFMVENLKYPENAKKSGIQGRVFVTFVVEKDGTVTDVSVLRGIGGGCDEEAVRVIEAMPKWLPGRHRSEPVRVRFNMPIHFSLEKEKKSEQEEIKQPAKPEFKQIPIPK
jgi:TonB family protein